MRIRDIKEKADQMDHWPVMEKILGIQVRPRQMLRSPLRDNDKHPSFGLFRDKQGQAKWKDFAMDNGDVYHLAMEIYKDSFSDAVRRVGNILGIENRDYNFNMRVAPRRIPKVPVAQKRATITWKPREWNVEDIRYWYHKYCLKPYMLDKYGIHMCEELNMSTVSGKELTFRTSERNPMYLIEIGKYVKLYRPMNPNRKMKYIGNTGMDEVFGLKQLEESKLPHLVICAGQKDAINVVNTLGVNAIAFNAEGTVPEQAVWRHIFMAVPSGNIFVMYDNDETGRKYSKRLVEKYPEIKPIEISTLTKLKDFSDIVEAADHKTISSIRELIHNE